MGVISISLKSQGCIQLPRRKSEPWGALGTKKYDQGGIASELRELVGEVFWKLNKRTFQRRRKYLLCHELLRG